MAAVTNAADQPENHTELEPALAEADDGFALRTEMTADELRQCRAAATELGAKAALIDRIADTAQVIPDRQTLELDDSAVTITERSWPARRAWRSMRRRAVAITTWTSFVDPPFREAVDEPNKQSDPS